MHNLFEFLNMSVEELKPMIHVFHKYLKFDSSERGGDQVLQEPL